MGEKNNQIENQKGSKVKLKLLALLLLALFCYATFKYFSDEMRIYEAKKLIKSNQLVNIASEIYQTATKNEPEPSQNERFNQAEKNIILEQKVKIEELSNKYELLISKIETIKNQDKLSRLIIVFIDLEYQIRNDINYQDNLQKLEVLASNNKTLIGKIDKLKFALKNKPKSKREIKNLFQSLIPEIIAKKSELYGGQDLLGKIKNNITKSIVIRRTDGVVTKPAENVDFIIVETEKLIERENYDKATDLLLELGDNYKPILIKMISELKSTDQINKAISEIFSYLRELSHN